MLNNKNYDHWTKYLSGDLDVVTKTDFTARLLNL